MKSLRHPLFALLLGLASTSLAAATPKVLQDFSVGLKGLDGRFVQRVFDADEQMTEETQGRVALAAPRQFRWEYEEPFPQLIVADGDHVWIYDPDLEQAQVRKQSHEEQQSPLAALIDPGELERQFDVRELAPANGVAWVELTPKEPEDAQLASAKLGFSGGELVQMQLVDPLGQRTEIRFSGWQRNPSFAGDTFRFAPPPGVDVVGDMAEGAQVFGIPD